MNTVSDRWVELIRGAQRLDPHRLGAPAQPSGRRGADGGHRANPDLDIQVYLDDQEYLAESTNAGRSAISPTAWRPPATASRSSRTARTAASSSATWSSDAGIALRYKYYAYRWDYHYAEQMHDKFMIVDDSILVTGSYNLSDNAEHGTMENDLIFSGEAHQALIDAFTDRFEAMWVTGEADGLYDALMADITDGSGSVPIVFDSMALSWEQVTELKRAIRDACPAVDSQAYRDQPERHYTCAP